MCLRVQGSIKLTRPFSIMHVYAHLCMHLPPALIHTQESIACTDAFHHLQTVAVGVVKEVTKKDPNAKKAK
jgi:hypothetical protein